MKQVNAEQNICDYIKRCDNWSIKTAHNIVVDLAANKSAVSTDGIHCAEGEIEQVPNQLRKHDDACPAHGATCKLGHLVVARTLILDWTCVPIEHGQ